jgi:hypothetical protein
MKRVLELAIEFIYWVAIFISPLLFFGFVSFIIYQYYPAMKLLSLIICILGILSGVFIAERIRRKYGCSKYMSRLISTPDIWPTDTLDRKDKKMKR